MSSTNASPGQVLLGNPLSDETRNERKALIALSAAGILIAKTGSVPSKIGALGIDFSPSDKHILLKALAMAIIYFAVAFVIYAFADFVSWRLSHREAHLASFLAAKTGRSSFESTAREGLKKGVVPQLIAPTSFARGAFEFILPLVLAIYSVICLFFAKV